MSAVAIASRVALALSCAWGGWWLAREPLPPTPPESVVSVGSIGEVGAATQICVMVDIRGQWNPERANPEERFRDFNLLVLADIPAGESVTLESQGSGGQIYAPGDSSTDEKRFRTEKVIETFDGPRQDCSEIRELSAQSSRTASNALFEDLRSAEDQDPSDGAMFVFFRSDQRSASLKEATSLRVVSPAIYASLQVPDDSPHRVPIYLFGDTAGFVSKYSDPAPVATDLWREFDYIRLNWLGEKASSSRSRETKLILTGMIWSLGLGVAGSILKTVIVIVRRRAKIAICLTAEKRLIGDVASFPDADGGVWKRLVDAEMQELLPLDVADFPRRLWLVLVLSDSGSDRIVYREHASVGPTCTAYITRSSHPVSEEDLLDFYRSTARAMIARVTARAGAA